MKKKSLFLSWKNSLSRTSSFNWDKTFREELSYDYNLRIIYLSGRFSKFSILKSRTYDRYMVEALCYHKFYGLEKIKFDRNELKLKRLYRS
jgi:hypothetical protein